MAELLISAGPGEWRAAWVEDGEAIELYVERGDTKPPGSVHLGRLVRVVASLDAALIDIGDERPAFLPLRDVPAELAIEEGIRLVVAVRREAWAGKAPRLTAKLNAPSPPAAASGKPAQLWPPPGLAPALALRLPDGPQRITADDAAILAELRATFPGVKIALRDPTGWPIDLDAAFDTALSQSLALERGTVHIAETEAATLIDVDTGAAEGGSSARAALAANRAAARLIARELRRRSIGGAVVIDFVGLDRRDHREQVRLALEAALAGDPARPQALGWTRLGHFELMRPRRGRSLADAMLEPGSRRKHAVALAYEALRRLAREARANPAASWRLTVSVAVAAALKGPAAAALKMLEARHGRPIDIATAPAGTDFDIAAL